MLLHSIALKQFCVTISDKSKKGKKKNKKPDTGQIITDFVKRGDDNEYLTFSYIFNPAGAHLFHVHLQCKSVNRDIHLDKGGHYFSLMHLYSGGDGGTGCLELHTHIDREMERENKNKKGKAKVCEWFRMLIELTAVGSNGCITNIAFLHRNEVGERRCSEYI